MKPRRLSCESLCLLALLALPGLAAADTTWFSSPVTTAYPLQFRARFPSTTVMPGVRDDLYERTFGLRRRSFDPRLCDTFACFDQNADTKVLVRYPMEEQIWASATRHDGLAPCGSRSDLLSTFERYDGCDTFLRRVERVTVAVPRANNEVKNEFAQSQVDRRPAPSADGDRVGRGTLTRHERTDRDRR